MVRQLLTESLVLAFIGGLLGVGVAWMGIDVLGQLDPLTLGVASALLFLVALGAAYLPARRAMRIDPMEALRAE